jgi:Zn-dependent peptidase ImmA (M78 family)
VSAAPLHPGERLARATLRHHGLPAGQPPTDLLGTIEAKVCVPVLIDRFNDGDIAGVLLRQADGENFIAINADHMVMRQRFTLAHEWGHIAAGHTPRVELAADLFGRASDPQEIEANYFAAELLAPRDALKPWLAEHTAEDVDAAAVAEMAMHFGIAFPTTCYRLERAGLISRAHKEELMHTLKAEGRSYARRFEESKHLDALEEIAANGVYPRAPRITEEYAAKALEVDLIDQEEYAEIMGSQDRLYAWLV